MPARDSGIFLSRTLFRHSFPGFRTRTGERRIGKAQSKCGGCRPVRRPARFPEMRRSRPVASGLPHFGSGWKGIGLRKIMLVTRQGACLPTHVRSGGRGSKKASHKAVGIDRDDAAKPIKQVGEAAAMSKPPPSGDGQRPSRSTLCGFLTSPSTGKDLTVFFHPPSFPSFTL